jgi:predicted nucleic acid-binding protein
MSDRVFLDTNIFVYSFDQSAPRKAAKAKGLIRDALANHKGVVSYQVVQEFFNVALRRFARPMKTAEAEQYLGTVFRPLLSVHSSAGLYAEALRLQNGGGLSWYDALIVGAALQSGCDFLLTEDLQHGRSFGCVRIENPFL